MFGLEPERVFPPPFRLVSVTGLLAVLLGAVQALLLQGVLVLVSVGTEGQNGVPPHDGGLLLSWGLSGLSTSLMLIYALQYVPDTNTSSILLWDKSIYQLVMLTFWSCVFTKVLVPVLAWLRQRGIAIFCKQSTRLP